MPITQQLKSRHPHKGALLRCTALAAAATLGAAAPALAQTTWKPTRPVTIVVPYVPGGGTDATARATAKLLAEQWGQPVLVENVPGADGLIGTRRVTESKPDGYTLLLQTPAIVLTKHTPAFKGIDPLARLVPVTNIAESPGVIVANAKFPASTLPELISYCKTATTPCSMGTGENVAKLFGRQMQAEALPNLIVANYKGTAAIITDMIANNVNFAVTGVASALPHQKAGTLKIVASQGIHRSSGAPDVRTVIETGLPQYEYTTWFGLFAAKDTPPAVTQGVYAAVRQAMRSPELQKAIAAAGAEPLVNTPDEFAAQVRKEDERFTALTKRFPLD
ncbi:tripartite tricarboxylate transporter substrate binding protein [Variovorax sp. J22R24]|uniref:tripartite tricarboxylate transporter substrate binding protein n=1 Tax=Variovorax gracilis TaxID=3053502 RepID=UPI0025776FF2|nr:tripartite tricarboxylate transporter substrate binding protein [Variovorax sp. J22R24]MDM0108724.1 tripartite tricarboxylate transporter substrate binding protein [Variovorax sp. J22R24]